MIKVKPNKVYKLLQTEKNKYVHVYCLVAGGTDNVGVVLNKPADISAIYEIIKKIGISSSVKSLADKYDIIRFKDSDVLSIVFEPLKNTLQRECQPVNKKPISHFMQYPHYSKYDVSPIKSDNTNRLFENLYNEYHQDNNPLFSKQKNKIIEVETKKDVFIYPQRHIYKLKSDFNNQEFYVFCFGKHYPSKAKPVYFGIKLPPNDENVVKNASKYFLAISNEKEFNSICNKVFYFFDEDISRNDFSPIIINGFNVASAVFNRVVNSYESRSLHRYNQMIYKGSFIPDFFNVPDKAIIKSNCYVKLNNGDIAFLLKSDICLPVYIGVSNNVTTINVAKGVICDVTKRFSKKNIVQYGVNVKSTGDVLYNQIVRLSKPLGKRISCFDFFTKLNKLKSHPKIKGSYKRIFDMPRSFSQEQYNLAVNYILELVLNEQLLNYIPPKKIQAQKEDIIAFDYLTYKGTNGIFYTLKDESVIFEDVSLRNIHSSYTKKFAYIPASDKLRTLFNMLVVDIELVKGIIKTELYKKEGIQKNTFAIKSDRKALTFDFVNIPDEDFKVIFNIIATVCNTTFKTYEPHNYTNYNKGNNKGTIDKSITQETAFIDMNVSKSPAIITSKLEYVDINDSKGMHFRRGHWHKYWCGPHSKPEERRLEPRWVKETIVNRNAQNIVITL